MTLPGKRRGIRTGRRDWLWGITLGIIVLIVIGSVALVFVGSDDVKTYDEVDGVKCQSGEMLDYHIHPNLMIFVEGNEVLVPANIGIRPNECLFWLHTHADVPRIHVEAGEKQDFTLGQFFAIWGQPLSETQLLDNTADATHEVRATVDGEPFAGNPGDIIFEDGQKIVLEFD